MEIRYTLKAQDDLKFWKKSGQKSIQKKIEVLINDTMQHPKTGLGKPRLSTLGIK